MYTLLLFIGIGLNVAAQVFLKYAAAGTGSGMVMVKFKTLLFSWLFWIAIIFYGLSFLLYTLVLTKFELSRAYPISSIGAIVLLFVISIPLYHEPLTSYKLAGLVISVAGILLLFK